MEDPADKVRHTVSFTHKQLGLGGAVLAAVMTLGPIKEFFVTREESLAQAQRLDKVEVSVVKMKDDLTAKIERSTDKIIDRIKDSEDRRMRAEDVLERRIEGLEAQRLVNGRTKHD